MDRVKRRWWTVSVTVLASLVVLAAVTSGLFQLAVLSLPGYRQQLSDYVSRVADRPIDIGGVALVWYRLRPQLELDDIVLYSDDGETPALSADRLRIGFGLVRLLHGDTFPTQIELGGLQVVVEIDANDQVHLRGLDTAGRAKTQHDWRRDIGRFDAIRLEDCTITLDDARLKGGTPKFHLLQAEARRRIGGASFDASVELPSFMGESAEFEGRINGDPAQPESWQGRWSLSMDKLARLPWLEARLPGRPQLKFADADLSVSGVIDQGRVDGAELQFKASSIAARRGKKLAQLKDIELAATARRSGNSWSLEVPRLKLSGASGPWPATRLRLQWTPLSEGGSELQADADFLRLQDLAPWMMLADDPSTARLAGVTGELRNLVGRGRIDASTPTYSLRAQLDGLGFNGGNDHPGFSGLKGEISATEAGGRLAVSAAPFELRASKVFAQPLLFDKLDGALDWTHDAQGWRINMPAFSWQLEGTQGQGDLKLLLPTQVDTSPEIRLAASFTARDATRLKPYMPVTWPQSLHDWLDRAIVSGRVSQGKLAIEGELAKFPFKDGDGRFQLDLDVADARLAYSPDWPVAEQVAARLQFRAGALTITSDTGKLSGNRVEHLVATIPDFKDAVLAIDAEVDGEVSRYYDFLRASPLAKRLSGLLTRTQGSGNASVAIKLAIPLHDVAHTEVHGIIRLKGVDLLYTGIDEPFRELAGELAFTGTGVSAQNVSGTFYGVPATAALAPMEQGNTRLTADLDYQLQSDGDGLSRYVPAFLRPYLSGGSHFRGEIVLGPQSDGLLVSSDLRGINVDLPVPIGKPTGDSLPLVLRIGGNAGAPAPVSLPPDTAAPLLITASYGDRLGVGVLMAGQGGAAGLQVERVLAHLGPGPIPVPVEAGVHIKGSVAELDLGDWIATLRRGSEQADLQASALTRPEGVQSDGPANGLRLQSIDLQADQLHYQGYSVGGVQLAYRPAANGGWSSTLTGDNAQGTVDWQIQPGSAAGTTPSVTPSTTLIARFGKLNVKARPKLAADPPAADTKPADPVDPSRMPALDIDAENLRLGDASLGHVRVNTARIDGGQKLSVLSATGGDTELKGSGEWLRRGGASTAKLVFDLDTRTIGDLLEGFGYARNVSAKRGRFNGDLTWPLAAAGIELAQAQGRIGLDMDGGSFSAVEPGAGRVLGLLNVFALPRRLTLDFRDVVSKGLGFDHVHGSFNAANGNASTDDLRIESPSLKIDVRGRVGLAARDYDQRITVYPGVSGGVTLGALLLGGPAVAVIALVAQEVLDKPLDQVTQLAYRVTGSWDNPQVKRAE
ncbi:MAG: hypothetical protein JWQ90_913 [Hydrocarboniphaga sp.]|uniref:YhdP family protein n=1 Tax=Hydrocarboniphaga sp. TaxID=2033016 RepID=UPI00262B660D|nr:YhdP family protein [Hydrocarboniphaga sp.]MDB5968463.1 hypothetical protein [Hydrocarboniphaga sp.]